MQSNVNFVTDGSKVYHLGGNDWYAVTQDKDKVMLVDTDCNVNGNKFEAMWHRGCCDIVASDDGQDILNYCNDIAVKCFAGIKHAIEPKSVEAGTGKLKNAWMWPMSKEECKSNQVVSGKIIENSKTAIWTRTFSCVHEDYYRRRFAWAVFNLKGGCKEFSVDYEMGVAPAFYLKKAAIDHIAEDGKIVLKSEADAETNFRVNQLAEQSFAVLSDSKRFGKNAIVFQGITYFECLDYIERTSLEKINLRYYVIKDMATWRTDAWEDERPRRSEVEYFDTVDEAIERFKAYKAMDYLKTEVYNPDSGEPMRRLVLGVANGNKEYDVLHTFKNDILLVSDFISEDHYGYSGMVVCKDFVKDLNKIVKDIGVELYSEVADGCTFTTSFVRADLPFIRKKTDVYDGCIFTTDFSNADLSFTRKESIGEAKKEDAPRMNFNFNVTGNNNTFYGCSQDTKCDDNSLWDVLMQHRGHNVSIVSYGDWNAPENVCLECENCNEVILDAETTTICGRKDC